MIKPRVKICCIKTLEEANLAIYHGANAVGLVGHMPSGPGVISDDQIKKITQIIPPGVSSFLLTSETDPQQIIAHHQRVHTSTLQIVDKLQDSNYKQIRTALPSTKIVQVIHVIDEEAIREAVHIAPQVDAILLDSGNPNLKIKILGGTGKAHNWEISKKIREEIDKPIYLAGGIHAKNVHQAIDTVQPFGIDLCSGVRTAGKLDPDKLAAFFRSINQI